MGSVWASRPRRPILVKNRVSPRREHHFQGLEGSKKHQKMRLFLKSAQTTRTRKLRGFGWENRVFLRFGCVFWPRTSAKPKFFGLPGRKTSIFTVFQGATRTSPHLGPTWANLGRLEPTWGQLSPNLGPAWPNLDPTWTQLRPKIEPNAVNCAFWGLPGANLGRLGPTWGQLGANLGPLT